MEGQTTVHTILPAAGEVEITIGNLFEALPDPAILTDQQGRIVQINSRVGEVFGYSIADVLGQPIELLLAECHNLTGVGPGQDYSQLPHTRPMSEGIELVGRCKDGRTFPVDASVNPVRTDNGLFVLWVVRDISLHKRERAELKNALEELNATLVDSERQVTTAAKLAEFADVLQSCCNVAEAFKIVEATIKAILPFGSGVLYITAPSRNVVEGVAIWGNPSATEKTFSPQDCWALRRGKIHREMESSTGLRCAHIKQFPAKGYLCVPLAAQGETLGVLYTEFYGQPDPWLQQTQGQEEAENALVVSVGQYICLALTNLKLREALHDQSIRDPLTRLFNRRYMEETLERELRRAARAELCVAVLMLDVDHFKQFNDTFGHQAGDALLRELGSFLAERTRGQDVACRYGGEEFVLVLTNASVDAATKRAELLREEMAGLTVHHEGRPLGNATLSIGISVFPKDGQSADEILRVADQALYRAKAEGRNKVVVG